MTYEIRMTPEAKTDLRSIFEYIAVDLQSVQNASGQFDYVKVRMNRKWHMENQ